MQAAIPYRRITSTRYNGTSRRERKPVSAPARLMLGISKNLVPFMIKTETIAKEAAQVWAEVRQCGQKTASVMCTIGLILCYDAWGTNYGGVEFPQGAASFADEVIAYNPLGDGVSVDHANPANALGIPDYTDDKNYVSLGASDGGYLILKFTDNSLTTSGDSEKDLWIFEIGPAVEPTQIYISQNGTSWINLGLIQGSTRGIDIDSVVPGGRYSYVKLVERDPSGYPDSFWPYAGADIDAVGAISSAPPVNTPEGDATIGLLAIALAGLRIAPRGRN